MNAKILLIVCMVLQATCILIAKPVESPSQIAAEEFHLIAGSYQTFDAANEALESLEDEGFEPIILFPAAGKSSPYRVSIYHSQSRDEVAKYQALLKKQGKKAGWIYEVKEKKQMASANRLLSAPVDPAATEMHYLIIASLDSYESALEKATALSEEGFEPEVLFPGVASTKYRISVYRTTDREEIDAYASMLKKQGKAKGWVMTKPLDRATLQESRSLSSAITMRSAGTAAGLRYHLIAGSFDNYTVAQDFAEEMKGQGYNALIVFPEKPTGNYRVSIFHSDNRDEVGTFGKQQKRSGKTSGWIYDRGK